MARLLRRTAYYKLGEPVLSTAQAPTFVAKPLEVSLASSRLRPNAKVRYILNEPATLTPAAPTFVSRKLSVNLTATDLPRRPVYPFLNSPAIVDPGPPATAPTTFSYGRTVKVIRPRQAGPVYTNLSAPTIVDPGVSTTPGALFYYGRTVKVDRPPQARPVKYFLNEPATLTPPAAPAFVARRIDAILAFSRLRPIRQVRYVLNEPATLTPPAPTAFIAPKLSVSFATGTERAVQRHPFQSTINPPQIVDDFTPPISQIAPTIRVVKARSHRLDKKVNYVLRRPATLTPPVAPFRPLQSIWQTSTTRASRAYRGHMRGLAAPTVITPFVPPVHVTPPLADPNYFLLIHS